MDSKELPKCSQDIRNFNNVITFTPNKAQPENRVSVMEQVLYWEL